MLHKLGVNFFKAFLYRPSFAAKITQITITRKLCPVEIVERLVSLRRLAAYLGLLLDHIWRVNHHRILAQAPSESLGRLLHRQRTVNILLNFDIVIVNIIELLYLLLVTLHHLLTISLFYLFLKKIQRLIAHTDHDLIIRSLHHRSRKILTNWYLIPDHLLLRGIISINLIHRLNLYIVILVILQKIIHRLALLKSKYFPYLGVGLRLLLIHINIRIILMNKIVELVIDALLNQLTQQVLNFHTLRYAQRLIFLLFISLAQVIHGDFQTRNSADL